jgi:hypothetical protein
MQMQLPGCERPPEPSPARRQWQWEERFRELVELKRETGHPNPPSRIGGVVQPIGQWLNDQRYRWRRGQLESRKAALLDALGVAWGQCSTVESVDDRQLPFNFEAPAPAPEPGESPEPAPWEMSSNDIEILHLGLLQRSLEDLRDGRCGAKTREEILEWVMAESDFAEKAPLAFSFRACALLAGCDPAQLRQSLLDELKRIGVQPTTVTG